MDDSTVEQSEVVISGETISEIKEDLDNYQDRHLFLDLDVKNRDFHLNKNLNGLFKSATIEINEKSAVLEAEGKKIYRFGLGQSPFPVPDVMVKELQNNAHQKDYLPVKGLRILREQVADYHSRKHQIKVTGNNVLIGPGSKELLFILQLVFEGELIVPSPCWVSYIPQAIILGKTIRVLHTDYNSKFRLLADQLEDVCEQDRKNKNKKARLLVLNYPDNPSGQTYTENELKKLAKVAKKYNILILSDEIYSELNFDGSHKSIATYYPDGTIISGGISKWVGAGGWRLGTFTFPQKLTWLQNAMSIVASETYTSVSAPIQYGSIEAFIQSEELEIYLNDSRRILKAIGEWITKTLIDVDVLVWPPLGGFYVFGDFYNYSEKLKEKGIDTAKKVTDKLLEETGVAILPGVDFARPATELTFRLAFVNFDGGIALEKAKTEYQDRTIDQEFLEKYCTNTLEGIRALVKWLNDL
jgi:aspartate aminotransferase